MKSGHVVILGIVVALLGLGMPATQTAHSEACMESGSVGGVYVEGQCAEGAVTVPNMSRGPVIGLGVVILIVGLISPDASTGESERSHAESRASSDEGRPSPKTTEKEATGQGDSAQSRSEERVLKVTAAVENQKTGANYEYSFQADTTEIEAAKEEFQAHLESMDTEIVSDLKFEEMRKEEATI